MSDIVLVTEPVEQRARQRHKGAIRFSFRERVGFHDSLDVRASYAKDVSYKIVRDHNQARASVELKNTESDKGRACCLRDAGCKTNATLRS
jgi:hypothetical protein